MKNRYSFKLIFLGGCDECRIESSIHILRKNERMTTKEKVSEPTVLMTVEEFARKYPVSKRTGGRGRSDRIQKAIDSIAKNLSEKKTGYIVIDNDPFFGSGISAAIKKQFKETNHIVLHWFNTGDPETKAEVSKVTKQTSRYLVQVELI